MRCTFCEIDVEVIPGGFTGSIFTIIITCMFEHASACSNMQVMIIVSIEDVCTGS